MKNQRKMRSSGGSAERAKAKTQKNPLKQSALVAQTDENIESAKFDFFMFKQTLLDLFDEFRGNHSRVGRQTSDRRALDAGLIAKINDAEQKLEKVEVHFDGLATAL